MASYFRKQLEDWLKTIEINTNSVLDVGGGANPIVKRLKSFEAKDYHILDNYAEREYHNSFEYPHLPIDIGDREKITQLVKIKYDVIFCLEVAEYLYNPLNALENMYLLLKPDGILYISFPTIYPVHQPKHLDYLRYTRYGVEKLLIESGFNQYEIKSRVATAKKTLAEFYSQEGMRAVKNDSIIFDIGYLVKAIK